MRFTRHQITGLIRITEANYSTQQAKMMRLSRAETELRAHLGDLRQTLQAREIDPAQDAAVRAGADLKWEAWVDQKITALNVELAQVLLEKQNVRSALKRAFGKYQVAEHFAAKTRQAEIKAADTRDERGY